MTSLPAKTATGDGIEVTVHFLRPGYSAGMIAAANTGTHSCGGLGCVLRLEPVVGQSDRRYAVTMAIRTRPAPKKRPPKIEVSAPMKCAGVEALNSSLKMSPEQLGAEIYQAVVAAESGTVSNG